MRSKSSNNHQATSVKTFEALCEGLPGAKWAALFDRYWPVYQEWFYSAGDAARPSYAECRRQLRQHMPELVNTHERLTELAGGSDGAARFLSMYCPPPYLFGCTQAIWTGEEPILIRNYDYTANRLEGTLWKTAWNGRNVIAMSDGMWGVLDGMNDTGLAVSLAFGGRKVVGQGFGIPLILRYILEFCDDVACAIAVLLRVPTHMSYNVSMVDRNQCFATVHVAPDRSPIVHQTRVATNFQGKVEWANHARLTATVERQRTAESILEHSSESAEELIKAFLLPPLSNNSYDRGFGTLYTAVYRPRSESVEFLWPELTWRQQFNEFIEERRDVAFPSFAAGSTARETR